MKKLTGAALAGVLAILLQSCIVGCQPNAEPLERSANLVVTEVVKPVMAKAIGELSQRTAQLTAQGSLINPGYRVRGYASFGTGVTYDFELNVVGVSANVAGATQADAGQEATVPPPVVREGAEASTPAKPEPPAAPE